VAFFGSAGTDYHIVAFSDTPGVNGGDLHFHMEAAPPPPDLSITLDKVGHVDARTGIATISGTWSCTGEALFADISGQMTQAVGRFSIAGYFDLAPGLCDGSVQHWSAAVFPQNGKFAGGKGAAVAYTYACGELFCTDGFAEQQVQLKK